MSKPYEPSDGELVAAALDGDQSAFARLYRRHVRRVASLIYRLWGSSAELEDLLQEAMLETLRSLPRLREPEQVGAFMRTIAARVTYDRIRSTRRSRRAYAALLERAEWADAASSSASRERVGDLLRVLDGLPAPLRAVWALHRIEGMTLEETAEACAISVSTVRRRVAEAQRKLDRRLGHG